MSEFILDKLEGFLLFTDRYFHWNLLKVKALSFYKNANISY